MRAWMNGQMLEDPTAPAIAVVDHGLTVGDGVFEAIKVLDGVPFALTRHLDRLQTSASALGLPKVDLDDVRRGVASALEGQHLPFGRIRITFTAGPAPLGSGRGDGPPTLIVVATEAAPYDPTTKVVTFPWPRNERGVLAGVKSTSYAENVIALAYAAERGGSEAIFANIAGHVCEGTGSNLFYVVDGELRTPTLSSGCLAGVTRRLIVEWTGAVEVDEPYDVLAGASEMFLASTVRDVQGIHTFDDRSLPAPGPVTEQTAKTWRAKEAEDPDP